MTTGVELEPAAGAPAGEALRFVAVRANLLPGEVLAARAADVTRKRVLLALAALVAVLAVAFGASWWQTHSAHNDLAVEQRRAAALQSQTTSFAPLVTAQGATASVRAQLQRLMAGDVSWQQMLVALQTQAPKGVVLTQVSATITAGSAATATTPPGPPTAGAIGSLTIVGTARTKNAVADYVDALARTKGLTAPFLNSVTVGDGGATFNLTVPITAAALGGRWAVSAGQQTGGK